MRHSDLNPIAIAEKPHRPGCWHRWVCVAVVLAWMAGLASCAAPLDRDQLGWCRVFGRLRDCAAVPLASTEADALAKTFGPPGNGKARVYVVRPYFQAWKHTTQVTIDGTVVAILAPGTFVMVDLAPGVRQVGVQTIERREIALLAEAGSNYYVEDRVDRLFNTERERLTLVTQEEAIPMLSRSRRIIDEPSSEQTCMLGSYHVHNKPPSHHDICQKGTNPSIENHQP